MSNMLSRGAEWLADQLESHASEPIRIVDGDSVCELNATRGATEYVIEGAGGVGISHVSVDFIITAARLDFGDGPAIPAEGFTIVVSEANRETTYDVIRLGEEQTYRLDPHGVMMRIHTKKRSVAS